MVSKFLKVFKLLLLLIPFSLVLPFLYAKFASPLFIADAKPPLPQIEAKQTSYAEAVSLASPAVVSIQTHLRIPQERHPLMQDPMFPFFFGDNFSTTDEPDNTEQGLGSGVIINKQGYILTNNHVIQDATSITVKLPDNRVAKARIIGKDKDTDIAVLKIELDKLPVIPMGASKTTRVGDIVLAIGNPFGFDQTVTQGIISATNRPQIPSAHQTGQLLNNLIQTDAAINPGNSGGALIDAHGHLIGINMSIFSQTGGYIGIGFAIPIDTAKAVMTELIDNGHISRGWLGTVLQDMSPEMKYHLGFKEDSGIFIRSIYRGSPAQISGILPGDIMTKIDNTPLNDTHHAVQQILTLKPGQHYPIEVYRRGKPLTLSVLIGEKPHQN